MWTLPAANQFHPQRAWPGSPIEWAEEHGSRPEPGTSLLTADDSRWIFQSATPILPKWPPRSMSANASAARSRGEHLLDHGLEPVRCDGSVHCLKTRARTDRDALDAHHRPDQLANVHL